MRQKIITIGIMLLSFGALYAQSEPDDTNWVSPFPIPSLQGEINGICGTDSNLYIVGDYDETINGFGFSNSKYVTKFSLSDSTFGPVGNNINGRANVIVKKNSNYYVGGGRYWGMGFDTVGLNTKVRGIAKWNGSSWSALGAGVNGIIYSIAVDGNNVYVGGQFDTAGTVKAKNIAKWNGSSWSAVGTGTNGRVRSICIKDSANIFVGGEFDTAGSTNARNIAKWNGSSWTTVGSGISGSVSCIVETNGIVYAGGEFDSAGSVKANSIARWASGAWSSLGSGDSSGVRNELELKGVVNSIALGTNVNPPSGGSPIFICGTFEKAGSQGANNIARWSGSSWSKMGSGLSGGGYSIHTTTRYVYVGGIFFKAGGHNISRWKRSDTMTVDNGTEEAHNPPPPTKTAEKLKDNIPQPFKEVTKFNVLLESAEEVTISVLNEEGKLVEVIYKGLLEGEKEFKWSGKGQANGIYYYRITGKGIDETKKFVLAK